MAINKTCRIFALLKQTNKVITIKDKNKMETIISKEAINYEPTWTPEQLKNEVINKLQDYGYTVANNESELEGLSTGNIQKLEFESYLPDYSWDGLTVYITEHYNDAGSVDYVYSVDVRF